MRSKGGHHNEEKLNNKQGSMWLRASVGDHVDEISLKKKKKRFICKNRMEE